MSLFFSYLSILLALTSGLLAILGEYGGFRLPTGKVDLAPGQDQNGTIHRFLLRSIHELSHQQGVFALLLLSGIGAVIGGATALLTNQIARDILPLGLPWMHWHVRLDALSGFFLIIIGIGIIPVSLYGPGYIRQYRQDRYPLWLLGLCTGLFVAGMELVLLADDAFFFMIAWELMSVSSYFLVAFQHEHARNRRAAFLYLLMAVVGAIAIILAFGVLASFSHGFDFDGFRDNPLTPFWATSAFLLALVGFGMKAGLVPGHAWLPEAHPVAPSHISALMSGVMLKIAIYGLMRFSFDLLGNIQWQWGVVVLAVGTSSAVLGILYAFQQNHVKTLLAYSSIENMGIIAMGLGLAMIFTGAGRAELGVIGLLAALYHCLNHSIFKNLLFLAAGSVIHQSHESDLDHLGGLIHRMPKTAFIMLMGCVAISALPPLNGFVSEWLTFQAALQATSLESGVLRSMIPMAAAALAFTGALAAATFIKLFGIGFLGLPRSQHAAHTREVAHLGMLSGPGLLVGLCLLFGLLPTFVIQALEPVTALLLGATLPSASAQGGLWLTPGTQSVASYSAPFVAIGLLLAWWVTQAFTKRVSPDEPKRGPAWDCGFGGLNAKMQYTSTAFSQPVRRIFSPVWDLQESHEGASAFSLTHRPVRHHLEVGDQSWRLLYHSIGNLTAEAARRVARLQGGSIRVYITYSFATLLLLLGIASL